MQNVVATLTSEHVTPTVVAAMRVLRSATKDAEVASQVLRCPNPNPNANPNPNQAFFIDACPDVAQACEQVFAVLRPGGVWINHGPLLYHGKRGGPRLTSDELMLLLGRLGFEVLEQAFRPCVYSQDDTSMCRSEYTCLYYAVRKRETLDT